MPNPNLQQIAMSDLRLVDRDALLCDDIIVERMCSLADEPALDITALVLQLNLQLNPTTLSPPQSPDAYRIVSEPPNAHRMSIVELSKVLLRVARGHGVGVPLPPNALPSHPVFVAVSVVAQPPPFRHQRPRGYRRLGSDSCRCAGSSCWFAAYQDPSCEQWPCRSGAKRVRCAVCRWSNSSERGGNRNRFAFGGIQSLPVNPQWEAFDGCQFPVCPTTIGLPRVADGRQFVPGSHRSPLGCAHCHSVCHGWVFQ